MPSLTMGPVLPLRLVSSRKKHVAEGFRLRFIQMVDNGSISQGLINLLDRGNHIWIRETLLKATFE